MLMGKVRQAIADGKKGEEAISVLTEKQYDFLIDHDYDIESLWLTPQQILIGNNGKKGIRQKFSNGYNKKYPVSKQTLYNNIVGYLKSIGCKILEREKCNYRDIDFMYNGTKHKIVLSNPRT